MPLVQVLLLVQVESPAGVEAVITITPLPSCLLAHSAYDSASPLPQPQPAEVPQPSPRVELQLAELGPVFAAPLNSSAQSSVLFKSVIEAVIFTVCETGLAGK